MSQPILPPQTIGILGSGQLGRMLAISAREMGYNVHVFSPVKNSPTGQIADKEYVASYHDLDAVREFARGVDVVTYEFENVPAETARVTTEETKLAPGAHVLHVAQNRIREKGTLAQAGLPVTPHRPVESLEQLHDAISELGTPSVLKTAESGYDGKGQFKLSTPEEAEEAWNSIGQVPAILEAFVSFECEISVVAARNSLGEFSHYGAIENEHSNHILDISTAPAQIKKETAEKAIAVTKAVLEQLDVIGVLCVEFFVTSDGNVLINEIAPRPHNSGHLTVDGCVTSQFEQQLRAICDLPLGDTTYYSPTVMVNLLGDVWENGIPQWQNALRLPQVHLHLYGKKEARIGRKMGHITATAQSVDDARSLALQARNGIGSKS